MPGFVTDYTNGAVDRIPASYWADRLHSQVHAPLPRNGEFWGVTFEDGALELNYSLNHRYYLGEDVWRRTDGEPGEWTADDIAGWTELENEEDAFEAAALMGAA